MMASQVNSHKHLRRKSYQYYTLSLTEQDGKLNSSEATLTMISKSDTDITKQEHNTQNISKINIATYKKLTQH